jgi:hypothetical protein
MQMPLHCPIKVKEARVNFQFKKKTDWPLTV